MDIYQLIGEITCFIKKIAGSVVDIAILAYTAFMSAFHFGMDIIPIEKVELTYAPSWLVDILIVALWLSAIALVWARIYSIVKKANRDRKK